jgi:Thioesterase-like superfamily
MRALPDAFFIASGHGRYRATRATQGPWDPNAMHGGPPAALLATLATQRAAQLSPTLRLARLALDFMGGLPVADLEAAVTIPRPGRRVALVEATLSAEGRSVAVGRAWFINSDPGPPSDRHSGAKPRPVDLASPESPGAETPPLATPPPLPGAQPQRFFAGHAGFGYGEANEWRFTSGGFDVPGPAGVWARMRIPLIAGEPLTGLARLLVLADAANGISGDLPWGQWMFIPPAMAMTMLREPAGEWIHLAARTTLGTDGIGLCHGQLGDETGPVAIVSQPLLVART